ncbi:MAG: hypothetical protein RI907_3262 [Pseudomonadota bacterium]|jgi:hypothetical protein
MPFTTRHAGRQALALLTLVACHHAGATTADSHSQATVFDFYGHPSWLLETTSSVPHFTVDGVDVSVKAFVGGTQALVDMAWGGLGVTTAKGGNGGAISQSESLQFTFSQPVTLAALWVSGWDSSLLGSLDRATLSWGNQSVSLGQGAEGLLVKHFDLAQATATSFTLKGEGLLTQFRVAGLQLANPNCQVPEPGAWALMGLGLVGLGGVAARRRQPAA